ncbi:hypothetical protein ASG22_09135 [Chryseobacterium sp. Leaf405]|uniref:phospholipase effector Tle1 domain-containing protein n=1 Tax=Chryseobacterium sp. Leaf405 TaxID=1736367 RepID=UPI0006F9AE1B|nr:DUF2235 domain-containing protein [Chryseobacterium sp. Leaf405]KQT24168.1 hypothetical protein ASG22_09135 [Chryseobacterium sp. Leaf405]
MKILGDIRPITNHATSYTMVTNAGAAVKVNQWAVYHKNSLLTENNKGVFTFGINTANLTLKLVAKVRDPKTDKLADFHIEIKPLAGKLKIVDLYWQDINGDKIQDREVAYLDKVTLVVKTQNIPQGDTLKITIYEDEYEDGHGDSSRNMGEYHTKGVTKNGYAFLELNNMSLFQKKLNKMDYVDEGTHEFYAKVYYYYDKINEIRDKIQLKVKNIMQQMVQPYSGNKPVVIGKVDSIQKSKNPLNFTFGVFIDGTLNNMYNTEMKQKMDSLEPAKKGEALKEAPKNTNGLNRNIKSYEFKEIYKDHGDPKYGESSYENDLSNPAILFKNYTADFKSVFKIYTEGVGTHSAPKEQGGTLQIGDYKGDDMMEGPAFGMGDAGIKGKVKKSIGDVVKALQTKVDKSKQYIDTITFDVFGFSRGAAAARHFVHVVTHLPYNPKVSYGKDGTPSVWDLQGYSVPASYAKISMPHFGVLGQLLQDAGLLDTQTKVHVRFVGIYDTVPHHGGRQSNDVKDLGLDDVNKADYVVHMVAADEYRAYFDLVDISSVAKVSPNSKKKGGIELIYPGVHCDVGGAYSEGDGNHPYRINVSRSTEDLEIEKKEFVKQGWFREEELSIRFYTSGIILAGAIAGNFYRLEGYKEKISNQYSYIPLHIMAQFCTMKSTPINKTKLREFKDFKENWITGNKTFLQKIRDILWNYSFNGGPALVYHEEKLKPITDPVTGKLDDKNIQYNTQEKLKNYNIKRLRYHYLHWNATYGSPKEAVGTFLSGKNHPNMINGKRKRNVH